MNSDVSNNKALKTSRIASIIGKPLVRFLIAGLSALVIAFFMLLFMRFLVIGYDKSASAALTRYISVPQLIISRNRSESRFQPERPRLQPEIPAFEDDELEQESAVYLEENTLEVPSLADPHRNIDNDIMMPELDNSTLTTREKLEAIKRGLIAEDE